MIITLLLAIATSSATPATNAICVKTTITSRGRFINSEIVNSSGNRSMDLLAKVTLDNMNLSRASPKIERQTGYVIAKPDGKGSITLEFTGKLLDSCPDQNASTGQNEPKSGT